MMERPWLPETKVKGGPSIPVDAKWAPELPYRVFLWRGIKFVIRDLAKLATPEKSPEPVEGPVSLLARILGRGSKRGKLTPEEQEELAKEKKIDEEERERLRKEDQAITSYEIYRHRSRPLYQFYAQLDAEVDWVRDNMKHHWPDYESEVGYLWQAASYNIRQAWTADGIWNPKWDDPAVRPTTWMHEEPEEHQQEADASAKAATTPRDAATAEEEAGDASDSAVLIKSEDGQDYAPGPTALDRLTRKRKRAPSRRESGAAFMPPDLRRSSRILNRRSPKANPRVPASERRAPRRPAIRKMRVTQTKRRQIAVN